MHDTDTPLYDAPRSDPRSQDTYSFDTPSQSAPVFAFTGQGSQYPGMTARLYLEHPRYRHHLEQAAEALLPYTGTSVVDLIVDGDVRVHQTGFTQPTLFAVQYALTATLADAGVRPRAVIGHSIGEFAASVAAGALELAEAATLVAARGVFMQYLPSGGGMLAVSAAPRDVDALLAAEPDVGFGAFNGPASVTLSGELRALERIAEALAARGVRSTALQVSHAFHSDLMRPMLGTYTRVAAQVRHGIPRIPFYSTVRGRPLKPGEALDTGYWIRHITEPVRFAPAAARLLDELRPDTVVEIGPKPVLTGLLRKIADPQDTPTLLPACRTRDTGAEELDELARRLLPETAGAAGAAEAGRGATAP